MKNKEKVLSTILTLMVVLMLTAGVYMFYKISTLNGNVAMGGVGTKKPTKIAYPLSSYLEYKSDMSLMGLSPDISVLGKVEKNLYVPKNGKKVVYNCLNTYPLKGSVEAEGDEHLPDVLTCKDYSLLINDNLTINGTNVAGSKCGWYTSVSLVNNNILVLRTSSCVAAYAIELYDMYNNLVYSTDKAYSAFFIKDNGVAFGLTIKEGMLYLVEGEVGPHDDSAAVCDSVAFDHDHMTFKSINLTTGEVKTMEKFTASHGTTCNV